MDNENSINFNKIRFVEVLKKQQTLKNQKISLFNENFKEYIELLSYESDLQNQIYYNSKARYIFLIEEYLKENAGEAEAELFVWEFLISLVKIIKLLKFLKKKFWKKALKD